MRNKRYICISLMLYCLIFFAASRVWAGSNSAIPSFFAPSAGICSITPIPESAPGDPVRYTIDYSTRLYSISFAWGYVEFTGAKKERLPLQFKTARAGDYSLYWDSIVPAGATGTATAVINYLGIPGRIFRETATFRISQSPESVQEYVGSPKCLSCHAGFNPDIVNAYRESGHFFAMSPVSGLAPSYPSFTPGVPDPPPGIAWSDIFYVIGGYAWFANFSSADNATILTGPETQYNLGSSNLGIAAGFAAYSPDTPDPGRFDCGPCHTTGYVPKDNQGDNASITGTWLEDGVGCEACHGPGSGHALTPYAVKPELSSGSTCAGCHVRGSMSVVEASGGLILHQQQASELQASPHSFMQCTICHNPHASAHYDDEAAGASIVAACTSCHTGIKVGLNMSQLECIDCHMPYAVKAGASGVLTDAALNEYACGDMRSHIFKINTNALSPADMFSDNGTKLTLDVSGKTAGLTVNFACLRCHTSSSFDSLNSSAKLVHAQ